MKYLSYEGLKHLYSKILTRLGLKVDATGGDISETVIETLDTVENKFPLPAAGESVRRFFGKVLMFLKNIRPLTENINIYVSTTGSDTTGDGTSIKPFRTIQYAIDTIPKDLCGHTVRIYVANGTYSEVVNIIGFNNGEFRLYSGGGTEVLSDNCKVDRISIRYNTCMVVVAGFSIMTTTEDGIVSESCTTINLQYMKITGNAISSGKTGIAFYRCTFSVWNCQVSYHTVALFAYNSRGVSNNWVAGAGNNYGLYSSYGSVITTTGIQPAATTPLVQDAGGMFTYSNGSQIAGLFKGLSCTWGTMSGGYVRHGMHSNGQAMVTINIRVTLTTALTSWGTYAIYGSPGYDNDGDYVAVTTQIPGGTSWCYLNSTGTLLFSPARNFTAGEVVMFSATYLTNS